MTVSSFLLVVVVVLALVLWDTVSKVKSLSSRLSDLHKKVDELTRRLDESAFLSDEVDALKRERQRRFVERLVSEGADPVEAEDLAEDPRFAETILNFKNALDKATSPFRPPS
jgi:hypothetical protein